MLAAGAKQIDQIKFPHDVNQLQEANLPLDLAALLPGQSVTVEVLPEEGARTRPKMRRKITLRVLRCILMGFLLVAPVLAQAQAKKAGRARAQEADRMLLGVHIISAHPDLVAWKVEVGVAGGNVRFVLDCPGLESDKTFREMFTEGKVFVASENDPSRGKLTLMRSLPPILGGGYEETPLVVCSIVKKLNGDIFPLHVSSADFVQWKNTAGYRIDAETAGVKYTLVCTYSDKWPKTHRCGSLRPGNYRAALANEGSALGVYDADLNLIHVYRIEHEQEVR